MRKMGDRRLKQIDRYCSRSSTKTNLDDVPTNRAERRKFKHVLKHAGIEEEEIDKDALFEALRKHYSGR